MTPEPLALPITTDRLILRDVRASDAPAMRRYMGEPSHWLYQLIAPPTSEQIDTTIRNILASQAAPARDHYILGVSLRTAPDLVIGEGVVIRNADYANRQGEIGFGLARPYWRRGYGSELVRALLAAGFRQMKLHRISARCSPDNAASIRVMEKAGMVREALLRDQVFVGGRWWSTALYGVLEQEFACERTAEQTRSAC
jgi:RimJ/RimL family protein N-acetyltransferase